MLLLDLRAVAVVDISYYGPDDTEPEGRSRRLRAWSPLPDTVVDTIGTTIFGIAGLWLAGLGIHTWIVGGGRGVGFWLSAAPVAFGGAVVFGLRLVHDLEPTA